MKISELIEMLETEKRIHGDIKVHIQATGIDGSGQIAAGVGYYGVPRYPTTDLNRSGLLACFDKVVPAND